MFFKEKNSSSGLSLADGGFRLLTIEAGGNCGVISSSYGKFPDDIPRSDNIYDNSGRHMDAVFRYIDEKCGGVPSPVNLALPLSETLIRIVDMHGLSIDDAREAFKYEAENYFPFPAGECVYDLAETAFPTGDNRVEKRFIVAAAKKTLIENTMRAASSNGIKLASIEPSQIALERAVSFGNGAGGSCAYIYAGIDRSVLIISWRGSGVFYNNLSGLGEAAAGAAKSGGDTGAAVSFSCAVRSSLQFAASQFRSISVKRGVLFGPSASPQLCKILFDLLTLESIDLTDVMKARGTDLKDDAGGWETALGLALR